MTAESGPELSPLLLEAATRNIANYTIGFARFSSHSGQADAYAAGSGALVNVGRTFGILTAAHVLKALPNQGEIGLIKFNQLASVQRHTIEMGLTEKLIIGGDGDDNSPSPLPPDIGFLRLGVRDIANLKASMSFFNLDKRQQSIVETRHPTNFYFEGVSGIIGLWTKDHLNGLERTKGFRGLFGVGYVTKTQKADEFDLTDLAVSYDEFSERPSNYKGMSGGALWRVYFERNSDNAPKIIDQRIFGVAFHQSPVRDGERTITCHGPLSVYVYLHRQICKRWPDEISD